MRDLRLGGEALRLAVVLGAILLCVPACDRNTEPYVAGERPSQPDLARIFPAPEAPEGPGRDTVERSPVAQPAGATRGNRPPGDAAAGRGAAIRGTVSVATGVEAQSPPGSVLFVIARQGAATAGPPLAVVRIPNPRFPLEFEIGPEHVMMPTARFEGEIRLSARLDSDGNATTRLAGDLQGRSASALAPGAQGVEILLDQTL